MSEHEPKNRFSFHGWKFFEWFKGHWKTIKEAAKVLIPVWVSISQEWDPVVTTAVSAGFVGFASAFEYFIKEYKE